MHCIRIVSASGLLLLACSGDDGGDGTTSGSATTEPIATTSGSETGGETTPVEDTTSGDPPPASTGEPPGTTTDPSEGSTGDTTGGGVDGVVLQNDSWTPVDSLEWQTWPNMDDCWASTYTPSAEDYPFAVAGAIVAIGDAPGVFAFEVAVWNVDNQGMPDEMIDSATLDIDGESGNLTQIDFAALGLSVPVVEAGEFAIVMCHTEHMGEPSIAIDADGDVAAAGNWVYQQAMGEWVQAPDFFGIDGDFILRAVIQPQG